MRALLYATGERERELLLEKSARMLRAFIELDLVFSCVFSFNVGCMEIVSRRCG